MKKTLMVGLTVFMVLLAASVVLAGAEFVVLDKFCVDPNDSFINVATTRASCDELAVSLGGKHGILKPIVCTGGPSVECEAEECPAPQVSFECVGLFVN